MRAREGRRLPEMVLSSVNIGNVVTIELRIKAVHFDNIVNKAPLIHSSNVNRIVDQIANFALKSMMRNA